VSVRPDHLSEVELIRYIDQEMSEGESAAACSHLAECEVCRTDLWEITQVGREVNQMIAASSHVADAAQARRSLQARLEDAEPTLLQRKQFPVWLRNRMTPAFLGGAAGVLAIIGLVLLLPNPGRSNAEKAASLPNRALTPGMTRQVELRDVCREGDDDLDPAVPVQRKEAVFREYGISLDHAGDDFQVDYLISPQLGGTDDVRNLWPQSYKETTWNAAAKDELERHLSQLVCERKITLQEAQHAIAHDWIAAYQKYF
jgi:hypothetical protein